MRKATLSKIKWRKQDGKTWVLRIMPFEGWVVHSTVTEIVLCGIYKWGEPVYNSSNDKNLTFNTPKGARKWIGYKIKELLEKED